MPNDNLDRLQTEVSETTSVQDSAAKLLRGIGAELKTVKEELAGLGIDNARLNTLSDSLDTSTNDLAAAVAENTPAETGGGTGGGDGTGGTTGGAGGTVQG